VFEHSPDATTEDLSSYVRAAQRGDEMAFRTLYRTIQPGLLRYLRILVGADAEDIASETWLQVTRDLHSFKGDGPGFRRWITTIGRNRALDHQRYHYRRPTVAMAADDMVEMAEPTDTDAMAMEKISTDHALAMIATLPQEQAEAIVLRVIVGLDATSAGKVLGRRPGAVRTAAYRGLRRLHEMLTSANQFAGHSAKDTGGRHAPR
jgi:RNA polymerase sigma-70 factor (ECF subfamily)